MNPTCHSIFPLVDSSIWKDIGCMFCDQVSNLSSSSMSASLLNKSVWLSSMAAKKDSGMKDKSKSYNNPKSIAILYMQPADLAVQFWWVYFCRFRLKPADLPGPFLFQQILSPQILAGEICRFCFPPGTSAGFGWNLQKSRPHFGNGTSAGSIFEANELICGGFGSRQGRFLPISFETRRSLNHYPRQFNLSIIHGKK